MITVSKVGRFLRSSGLHSPLRFRRYLKDTDASYWGVYSSFAEAEADAVRKTGYDDPKMARMHLPHLLRVQPSDYPVMFHVSRLLPECRRIFDVGGNIGLQFYAFQERFSFHPDLQWTVCELPAIIVVGEQIRNERGDLRLGFTTDFSECDGADILLCGGSLQYIEDPIWERLAKLTSRPRHIIINRTPFTARERFVSMQNLGPVFCPNLFYNEEEFLGRMGELGYAARDSWRTLERGVNMHSHPELSVPHKRGMYLLLKS
jgi:putative methyltransferase (TIGR04325 family)